ncbi:MAG: hypothetical protein KBG85_04020 [Micropruina sp.]|nr:hypothetical protein [Micropruina sp.]
MSRREANTVTSNPQPLPVQDGSDHVDLDVLFQDAKPIGDGSDLAADVFETQEELEEFLTWLHADRAAGTV